MTGYNKPSLTRREFLKQTGVGTAAIVTAGLLFNSLAQAAADDDNETGASSSAWGLLIDLTRCTGCDCCALACKACNHLPQPECVPTTLDSQAYTFVAHCQLETGDAQPQTQSVKRQCMHCLQPACVSACTVGALRKTAAGPVVYDAQKCIGCRYCQYACPFGVPAYDWDNPLGLIHKCQMCATRLAQGQKPACVEACPNGALRFGRRAALLAQARGQIASNPERYLDHIYGEHEAGGTSVLYLSAIPFETLDFPSLGPEPIAHQAEAVMQRTPAIALTVAGLATWLHWFTGRRQHSAEEIKEIGE